MTDGDPDVFLTASYLRDVLRRMLFIKATPERLSVCEIFYIYIYINIYQYSHVYSTGATTLSFQFPVVHHKCERDYIVDQTANSFAFEFYICNKQELEEIYRALKKDWI